MIRPDEAGSPKRTRVAVIGGNPATLEKAVRAGLSVIWIHHVADADPAALSLVDEAHLFDFEEPDAVTRLVAAVHAATPVERVVALTERGLLPAAHAVHQLGVEGVPLATASMLSDKLAMRTHLAAVGISPVRAAMGHDETDLREFVRAVGPTIVKPRSGSGSLGVRAVQAEDEVGPAWTWARGLGLVPFLMEERLTGPEVSVETLTVAGRHTVVAITAKETGAGFVELGHVVPAPLGAADAAAVGQLVVNVLDAVGLTDGPGHTEVVLTAGGPRVIESHNRRGGDRISDLVREVYGFDLDEAAFRSYAGEPVTVDELQPSGAAAVRFLVAEPGVVRSIEGVERARQHPHAVAVDIHVSVGDTVRPLLWSNDRVGLVLARGSDPEAARRHAAELAELVRIETAGDIERDDARTLAAVLRHPGIVLSGGDAT